VVAQQPAAAPQADLAAANNFAEQGEIDFKAGNYSAAARDWQHALVDDPRNGALILLLAQTLFAMGQYDEAAGATQAAMQALPDDKWGVVVTKYNELYGNVQDYTDQIRKAEAARDAEPEAPAVRFLLGFHFGYLGYPKQAVTELDKALTLVPQDVGARKLRDVFAAQWPEAPLLPAAAVEAEKQRQQAPAAPAPGEQPPGQPAGVPAPPVPNPPAVVPPGVPS
jgi:tetratricopeptide (TPR) repeat protein